MTREIDPANEARERERAPYRPGPRGLCPECAHVKLVGSSRGSTFLLCQLSKVDPLYARYPPQPRMVCPGFKR